MQIFNNKKSILTLGLLFVLFGFSMLTVSAQPANPPSNNVPDVINSGPSHQVKDGRLDLQKFLAGDNIFFRITSGGQVVVGFGANPPAELASLELERTMNFQHLLPGEEDFDEFLCTDENGLIAPCVSLPIPDHIQFRDPGFDSNISKLHPPVVERSNLNDSFLTRISGILSQGSRTNVDIFGGDFQIYEDGPGELTVIYGNTCNRLDQSRNQAIELDFDYIDSTHLQAVFPNQLLRNLLGGSDSASIPVCLRYWENGSFVGRNTDFQPDLIIFDDTQ